MWVDDNKLNKHARWLELSSYMDSPIIEDRSKLGDQALPA